MALVGARAILHFSSEIYHRHDWICGCNIKNALFWFSCILFGGDKAWTEVGVTDLVHLSEKIKKHADETSDISGKTKLVTIFRYVFNGEPPERFWNYISPEKCDADNLTSNILSVEDPLIGNFPNNLLPQMLKFGCYLGI
ncbi:unnamed protein product [Acanthoscelides obtectus]|uniref:Uncharacterized protein n=1 Tax=Acanthoscelides obtectus TaxID=200917 RepID=A0A9P0QA61_ACAOB|nr:unnamed protein product [Acanthoscelides obtectus]CAK1632894.1 hypothetical protein AOBTE_LOCUS7798 [Acanthoscelides obtectus]